MTILAGDAQQGEARDKRGRPSIWLALSGGGFRAAIFHYGCLKRLHELGLLGHVYAISATSGGAVVAALLEKYWGNPRVDWHTGAVLEGWSFKWENFERVLLSLVRGGILAPTLVLVSAYASYGAGLALLGVFILSHIVA
jgi:Patatin-like phospholipase